MTLMHEHCGNFRCEFNHNFQPTLVIYSTQVTTEIPDIMYGQLCGQVGGVITLNSPEV